MMALSAERSEVRYIVSALWRLLARHDMMHFLAWHATCVADWVVAYPPVAYERPPVPLEPVGLGVKRPAERWLVFEWLHRVPARDGRAPRWRGWMSAPTVPAESLHASQNGSFA